MKKSYLISLAVSAAIFTGCGVDTITETTTTPEVADTNVITVQRGPILSADVIDANGQIAVDIGNGQYRFNINPSYPIMATNGVIDVDRDGQVSVDDVVNDLYLATTGGSVITVATTLAANTQTRAYLDTIAALLGISMDDILNKTPDESRAIEAVSNILYKYVKDNNISSLINMNATQISQINTSTIIETYNEYVIDSSHDVTEVEKTLMDSLADTAIDRVDHSELQTVVTELEAEVDSDHIESVKTELEILKNKYELEYGDMDYEDEGDDQVHNQGVSCASCHTLGVTSISALSDNDDDDRDDEDDRDDDRDDDEHSSNDDDSDHDSSDDNEYTSNDDDDNDYDNDSENNDEFFDSGATVFTTLDADNFDATKAAYGYSIRLLLEDGTIENYSMGEGTGNVHASFNAGITNYTAQVLDPQGNVVNASQTNSHDASRFDCNSCHTQTGANGAPGRITSFQYTSAADINITLQTDTNTTTDINTTVPTDTNTTATISFLNDVEPILQTNCASCHGNSGNFSITNANTPYDGVIPFVDTANVDNSLILLRPTGWMGHRVILDQNQTEYTTIREWIVQGAQNN